MLFKTCKLRDMWMTIALDVITIGNNLDNTVSSQEIQCSSTAK